MNNGILTFLLAFVHCQDLGPSLDKNGNPICARQGNIFVLNRAVPYWDAIEACGRFNGEFTDVNDSNYELVVNVTAKCQSHSKFWIQACYGSHCKRDNGGCSLISPWEESKIQSTGACQQRHRPVCRVKSL